MNLYVSATSDRGKSETTRGGNGRLSAHVRGWDLGIRVEAFCSKDGKPSFIVYKTGGSNGATTDEAICEVSE